MISPELGALRQQLRFRRLMIEQEVMFKNKTAGLLMEAGPPRGRLEHNVTFFPKAGFKR